METSETQKPERRNEIISEENITESSLNQGPLSAEQIAKMEERRGRSLTQEEIKYINDARARGIHHDLV